jgi:hypothetical protein
MPEPTCDVVAIQGDAARYHPYPCARIMYGRSRVEVAIQIAQEGGSPYDYFTQFEQWCASQPHDHQGDVLVALCRDELEDLDEEACSYCLGLLSQPPR